MNRLQGLGAPINIVAPSTALDEIDPTLDACCQREIQANRQANALDQTLAANQHLLLQQERIRRNLVDTLKFSGCRCCYDPENDGTGDYRALQELRQQREEVIQLRNHEAAAEEDETAAPRNDSDNNDDDDDDDVYAIDKTAAAASYSDDSDSEFDYLLDDDNDNTDAPHDTELQRIQANRLAQLQVQLLQQQMIQQHGYGAHRQMHPTRVLRAAGLGSSGNSSTSADDLVVVHLYDPDSTTCAQLDLYLEQTLAPKYPGTKFLRCGGRSCLLMDAELAAKALGRSLQADRDVPALVAVKHGVVVATCPSLQGLYDYDGAIVTSQVDEWLDRAGVLSTVPPQDVCRIRPEEDALMEYLIHQKNTDQLEKEEMFQCGVAGCEKAFYHEHVGIETEHQSGLVVKESEILRDEKKD